MQEIAKFDRGKAKVSYGYVFAIECTFYLKWRFHYETENYHSENPKTEHGILRISKTEKIFSQNYF